MSNFGAANPRAAAKCIRSLAKECSVERVRIAVVEGDDLSGPQSRELLLRYLKTDKLVSDLVSANVYLGAEAIAAAICAGAEIVVTGRVADPSLVVGPALAQFDWPVDDWNVLGRATMAGHLLECGSQVSGGYFADPGFKDIPNLHNVGFPVAEIQSDGSFFISKPPGTGGAVTLQTVKEQLLYEVHDPAAYRTPDVVADISQAEVINVGPNQVAVHGIQGHARPETLKATVCYTGGWLGEGEISYAGPNAFARARLAADIIERRIGSQITLRADLIGTISVFGDDANRGFRNAFENESSDVRLRVAGSHADREVAENLLREITALYTCGPAGGGGIRTALRPRLYSESCFLPRSEVHSSFTMME